MTPADLDRLDELASKATPGPWGVYRITYEHQPGHLVIGSPDQRDLKHDIYPTGHDAAFIAASRTAIPALIAEVRRLRRGADGIKALIDECDDDDGECIRCIVRAINNVDAGREWSDNGTTAVMPRKGNDNGV